MGIKIEIVSVAQLVDFDNDKMDNQMIVRLPDGTTFPISVSDTAMAKILSQRAELFAGTPQSDDSPDVVSSLSEQPTTLGHVRFGAPDGREFATDGNSSETISVFGGDAPTGSPQIVHVEEPAPEIHKRPQVSRNAMGYPVVHVEGGKDPGEITGGGDGAERDEDGVAQI